MWKIGTSSSEEFGNYELHILDFRLLEINDEFLPPEDYEIIDYLRDCFNELSYYIVIVLVFGYMISILF